MSNRLTPVDHKSLSPSSQKNLQPTTATKFTKESLMTKTTASIGLTAIVFLLTMLGVSNTADAAVGATPGSFSVNNTGAATYTVPIVVPPGINGMQPQIALTYNSQSGDGIAGMGWSLSGLSSITRCPATIAHDGAGNNHGVRFDSSDKFCLDGKRLRLDSGTYGNSGAVYRLEIDDFTRITQQGSGPDWFLVEKADGTDIKYGNAANTVLAVGSGPTNTRWLISEVLDTGTNIIKYTYSNVGGVLQLDKIEYSEVPGTQVVEFAYEARPAKDQITRYFGGSSFTQTERLKTITTKSGVSVVKTYTLAYEAPVAGRTDRSRLISITECGSGDCFPATTFQWLYGSEGLGTPQESVAAGNDHSYSHVIDFNGDGFSDIVYVTNNEWHILPGQLNGGFGTEIDTNILATNKEYTKSIDFDGDGYRDLIVANPTGNWVVLKSNGTTLISTDTFIATGNSAPFYTIADTDGDALEDIVVIGGSTSFWVHRNLGGSLGTLQSFHTNTPHTQHMAAHIHHS